jgi:alkylhydroperoxidase family enzyme
MSFQPDILGAAMTWLPVDTDAPSERDAVLGLHPTAYARHREFLDATAAATDPELLELCKLRMAQHFGCREELARHSEDGPPSLTALHAAALDFVDQFVLDPSLVSREQVAALEGELGTKGVIHLTMAVAAHEASLRLSTVLDLAPAEA